MKQKTSAINIVWLGMILIATVTASWHGTMKEIADASFDSAKFAIKFALLNLLGPMALWLGIMKVLEAGGLMKIIAKVIRPIMVRLFPDVPAEHPAMSAMIMNMAANALGLGNAATPMGIKAMNELDKLNPQKGTATDAMCLFLAINTSSVTILPLGAISVRAAAGAENASAILLPSIIATVCSTSVAILMSKFMTRNRKYTMVELQPSTFKTNSEESDNTELSPPGILSKTFVYLSISAFLLAIAVRIFQGNMPPLFSPQFNNAISNWLMPILMSSFLLFGFFKGVKVYEEFTNGAKDGFSTTVRIIPYLIAIFVAIGMLRASGALEILVNLANPITSKIGMPAEALTLAILRPLSGSGSFGIMSEIVSRDPNSFLSYLVSTMQGSTETTFYVLAVYFGSVGIIRTRHALPVALTADLAGILASVAICNILW